MNNSLIGSLIGLAGVLLGIGITEFFNRKKRIEAYAQKVFEKRLDVYERLFRLIRKADEAATATFENGELTEAQRSELISAAVMTVAEYCDNHGLYIDGYVGASITATFIGVEDIAEITDQKAREQEIFEYHQNLKAARKMIMEESGIWAINKHFKLVSKSRPDSPIIARIKELENEQRKKRT